MLSPQAPRFGRCSSRRLRRLDIAREAIMGTLHLDPGTARCGPVYDAEQARGFGGRYLRRPRARALREDGIILVNQYSPGQRVFCASETARLLHRC
jgi:hypothetical protein